MVSSISWIDYSEQERRKALDAISLFKESGTVDDLGIGTIRDAFADILFPGTSTIQTRARYFLLIPWVYLDLERSKVSSREAAHRARRREVQLIELLASSNDKDGVIGIEARDKLKRLPSDVYWQGLETWGIRLFHGSRDQYYRSLDRHYVMASRHTARVAESMEIIERKTPNWHPALPPMPKDLWEQATLALTLEEAEYLRERIMARVPGTLLAFLVDKERVGIDVEYPWLHPDYANFSRKNREELEQAHNFSLVMHGAALVYNLVLAEKVKRDGGESGQIEQYRKELDTWESELNAQEDGLRRWNREHLWQLVNGQNPHIPVPTRNFVNTWLDVVSRDHRAKELANNKRVRLMIEQRERNLKGPRARLQNPRALELWRGFAGTGRLAYRWRTVRTILNDIVRGLEGRA